MLLLLIACTTDPNDNKDPQTIENDLTVLENETQVDEMIQAAPMPVDVLWVIDNSISMSEEQQALSANAMHFMKYFTDSGLDYHIGVVTTDMFDPDQSGQLVLDHYRTTRYIDNTFSKEEAIASFRERAYVGIRGFVGERAKDAAFAAIGGQLDANQGFYREEASLSIIVISDEKDIGEGHSQISVADFSHWMLGLKTYRNATVSFSSITALTRNECSGIERGSGLLEVTTLVGGIKWSICSQDWSGLLDELGYQAAPLTREFFLSLAPIEDSIEVSVDDPEFGIEDTWHYDAARNAIIFDTYLPPPLSKVSIAYLPLATTVDEELE